MSSQAHPPAIAWRVVSKVLIDGLTYEQVCSELAPMAVGSVHNILERFWRTGDVVTHQGHNPVGPPNTVTTTERVARLLECMLQTQAAGDGDEMLLEIYQEFLARENVVVDISTICRTLRAYGFTRNRAPRRSFR